MGFLAILLALLIEQARPLAYDNPVHAGLRSWTRTVRRNLDAGETPQGWVAWLLAALFPAVVAAGVHLALMQISVLLAFVWVIGVLYVTLGFRQFSHHFSEIRRALERFGRRAPFAGGFPLARPLHRRQQSGRQWPRPLWRRHFRTGNAARGCCPLALRPCADHQD